MHSGLGTGGRLAGEAERGPLKIQLANLCGKEGPHCRRLMGSERLTQGTWGWGPTSEPALKGFLWSHQIKIE